MSSMRWERPESYPAPVSPALPPAVRDQLTGLLGRLVLSSVFQHIAMAPRDQLPVSLLLGDLDDFGLFNLTHGDVAGDHLLIAVAHTLQAGAPRDASVYRVGGDEFAVVLPATDSEALDAYSERVLEAVQATRIPDGGLGATISLGGATLSVVPPSIGSAALQAGEQLLRQALLLADQATVEAKRSGRNRYAFRQAA